METKVYFLLFDDFETLDVFGPVEVLAHSQAYNIYYCSMGGGDIKNSHGVVIRTQKIEDFDSNSILVVPGGMGTRKLVNSEEFIQFLKIYAEKAKYVLTICTGSTLLAKTGLLKGCKATSNKKAFNWAMSIDKEVVWIHEARWVVDNKFYTSYGVSAGIDMTLGFVSDQIGKNKAEEIAKNIEYIWNSDKDKDPFVTNTF